MPVCDFLFLDRRYSSEIHLRVRVGCKDILHYNVMIKYHAIVQAGVDTFSQRSGKHLIIGQTLTAHIQYFGLDAAGKTPLIIADQRRIIGEPYSNAGILLDLIPLFIKLCDKQAAKSFAKL